MKSEFDPECIGETIGRLSDCKKVKTTAHATFFECNDSKTGKTVTVSVPFDTGEAFVDIGEAMSPKVRQILTKAESKIGSIGRLVGSAFDDKSSKLSKNARQMLLRAEAEVGSVSKLIGSAIDLSEACSGDSGDSDDDGIAFSESYVENVASVSQTDIAKHLGLKAFSMIGGRISAARRRGTYAEFEIGGKPLYVEFDPEAEQYIGFSKPGGGANWKVDVGGSVHHGKAMAKVVSLVRDHLQNNEVDEVKEAKLGSGKRFKALSKELMRRGASDSDALAAWIGRKKHGKQGMADLAAAGRDK